MEKFSKKNYFKIFKIREHTFYNTGLQTTPSADNTAKHLGIITLLSWGTTKLSDNSSSLNQVEKNKIIGLVSYYLTNYLLFHKFIRSAKARSDLQTKVLKVFRVTYIKIAWKSF